MAKFAVILPAAGQSRRFHDKAYKKPFAPLAGRAVWLHSAERFMNRGDVRQTIVVVAAEDREEFNRKFGANIAILGLDIVEGGAERADSVAAALERLDALPERAIRVFLRRGAQSCGYRVSGTRDGRAAEGSGSSGSRFHSRRVFFVLRQHPPVNSQINPNTAPTLVKHRLRLDDNQSVIGRGRYCGCYALPGGG